MAEQLIATLVLKPQVKVVSPPGGEALGKLLDQLIKAAENLDFQARVKAMEAAQVGLIKAGLPEEVVTNISTEILEAFSGNKVKINKLPTEHRLSRQVT